MSRKAKKAMAVALTAGMLASTAVTPVMAATQGWKQNSKGWWYQNADGSYPANKWSKINGVWYYFDANGYMLANSWVKDSAGKWYFVGKDGAMKTNGWAQDKAGQWYWLKGDGSMFEGGWARINNQWYFFKNDGVMQSGVVNVDGKTYYMGASNDGAMKTGKVSIETVEYNFNEDGACTDAKVPETTKVFDKKGNPVTPEVEIEKVNGINGAITNAISEYSEYGNVIIAGNDAYFKVLVTQNGEPVVGTPVALTDKCVSGKDYYKIKSLAVQNTDKDGYATFVIGVKEDLDLLEDITATSNAAALYELTANAVAINEVYTADLAFARVNMGEVKESTHDNDWSKSHTAIYPSANIGELTGEDKVAKTCGIDGNNPVEYIPSQQVSTGTSADHAVTFEINPVLEIKTKDAEKVDSYSQEINKSISEYSVYQDGSTTSFKVTDVPAGLRYATLNFENIDISEYTKVEIQAYKKGTTEKVGVPKVLSGITQKTFGYQIPVQEDTAIDVEIKVISEGQVNDSQNGGLTIKDIKGVYKTAPTTDVKIALNDCITWSETEIQYSEEKKMTYDEARGYGITAHLNTDYKYSYVVPVFPYVGNAIITVKDENKDVVAYYTLPTTNQIGTKGYQNENNIVTRGQAILVTEDEAFNKVGTVTANGNKVTVNSSATGYTALQAKIELKGFDEEINLLNDTSYTSVHWAPLPDAVQAADDFYALKGQYVTVTAQLLDRNGNKSSKKDVAITFSYVGEDTTDSTKEKTYNVADGALQGVNASATNVNALTDKNGQVTIKIASDDAEALVKELKATSSEGEVVLAIGDKNVEVANLHWVDTGLAFTSSVDLDDEPQYILSNLAKFAGKNTASVDDDGVKKQLDKEPGSSWIFGYEVVGETADTDEAMVWVDSIEGLKVSLSKDGSADMSTDGLANGVAKLTSTKSGGTKLTGKLDDSSITDGTDVVFNVATKVGDNTTYKKYTNVGEGKASLSATLDLPVSFGTVGLQISEKSIVAKSGNSEYSIAKSVIEGRTPELYIVATDAYGNKQKDKVVTYTISYYADKELIKKEEVKNKKTDENGLLGLDLASTVTVDGSSRPVTRAEISATIDNESLARVITVKYVDDTNITKFAMPSAKYVAPAAGSTDGQIELTFTQDVDKTTVDAIAAKDLFEVTYQKTGDNKTYVANVKSAKVDGKKVILTLDNKTFDDGEEFTVTVNSKEQDGITYQLRDKYGRALTNSDSTVTSAVGTIQFSAKWDDVNSQIKLTGVGTGDSVIAVYDKASGLSFVDGSGYETLTNVGTSITPALQANKEVSVTLYYEETGMSATVTIPESTITATGSYTKSNAATDTTPATPAKITVTYSREISKVEKIVVKDGNGDDVSGVTVASAIDTTDKTKVTYTLTFTATGTTDLTVGTYTITADVTGAESGNKAQTVGPTQFTVTQ